MHIDDAADAFDDLPSDGVSANLCESVATLLGIAGEGVEVGIAWAAGRAAPAGTPSRVQLTPDAKPILEAAAQRLRQIQA